MHGVICIALSLSFSLSRPPSPLSLPLVSTCSCKPYAATSPHLPWIESQFCLSLTHTHLTSNDPSHRFWKTNAEMELKVAEHDRASLALTMEKRELQDHVDRLRAETVECKARDKASADTVSSLRDELTERLELVERRSKERVEEATAEVMQLRTTSNTLESELASLQQSSATLQDSMADAEQAVIEKEAVIAELRDALQLAEQHSSEAAEAIEVAKADAGAREGGAVEMSAKLAASEREVVRCKDNLSTTEVDLESLRAKFDDQARQIEELAAAQKASEWGGQEVGARLSALQKQHTAECGRSATLDEKLTEALDKITAMESHATDSAASTESTQVENTQLQTALSAAQHDLAEVQPRAAEADSVASALASLQVEHNVLATSAAAAEEALKQLTSTGDTTHTRVAELEEDCSAKTMALEAAAWSGKELAEKMDVLKKETEAQRIELTALREERATMSEELKTQTTAAQETQSNKKQINDSRAKSLGESNLVLQEQLEQSRGKIAALIQRCDEVVAERDSAQSRLSATAEALSAASGGGNAEDGTRNEPEPRTPAAARTPLTPQSNLGTLQEPGLGATVEEFEQKKSYLRSVLFHYMIGTDTQHLIKVIAALVEFTPDQRKKVFEAGMGTAAHASASGAGWFSGLLSSPAPTPPRRKQPK